MTISLELDHPATETLSKLESLTGMSPSRIFSYALSLMLWAVSQRTVGRIVASVDESKQSYRELEVTAVRREQRQAA